MFEEFVRGHEGAEPSFEQLPFNHPLYIMFSSGTTGIPKCMVHSAGVSKVCVGVLCVLEKKTYEEGNIQGAGGRFCGNGVCVCVCFFSREL